MYGFIVVVAPLLCFVGAFYVGTHQFPNAPGLNFVVALIMFAAGVLIIISARDRWKRR